VIQGATDNPVTNIEIRGINFRYSTWSQPSTVNGYSAVQAGVSLVGSPATDVTMGAALTVESARGIRLVNNRFEHLGGAGILLDTGTQDTAVLGNHFSDISGAAIESGDTHNHHATNPGILVRNIQIGNNFITRIGVEYQDSPGIFAGYVSNHWIFHNQLSALPYTGISVGW
jgi:hypothetical protein